MPIANSHSVDGFVGKRRRMQLLNTAGGLASCEDEVGPVHGGWTCDAETLVRLHLRHRMLVCNVNMWIPKPVRPPFD